MTKQNKKNKKRNASKGKSTPFADAGAIVGSRFGRPWGIDLRSVGKWLGSGIGSIFGSGDYAMVGPKPGYSVLAGDPPKFSSTKATNIICHREYIQDISGTAAFNNNSFSINPGISKTFPWLSQIAANYQEYRFHGLVFEFRPLITDFVTSGAPGVVVMATDYNANDAPYPNKISMENTEYAVSIKPTMDLKHMIECDLGQSVLDQLYVRTGSETTDLRLYDVGNFQFATQGNPVQLLGELWVTYCIEFFKPTMHEDIGGDADSGFVTRQSFTGANPLGTIGISSAGDIDLSVTSTQISWLGSPGNKYLVQINWFGASAALTLPVFSTTTGIQFLTIYNNNSQNSAQAPNNGSTSTFCSFTAIVNCTLTSAGTCTLTAGVAGTLPGTTNTVNVLVSLVSNSAI